MLKNIETVLEKPILYKKTEGEFWNDEHISMQIPNKQRQEPDGYPGALLATVIPERDNLLFLEKEQSR